MERLDLGLQPSPLDSRNTHDLRRAPTLPGRGAPFLSGGYPRGRKSARAQAMREGERKENIGAQFSRRRHVERGDHDKEGSSVNETVPVLMERAKALQASMMGWSAPSPEAKSRQAALAESLHALLAELAAAPQSPDEDTLRQWVTRLHLLQAEFQEMLMPPRTAVMAVAGLSGLTMVLFLLGWRCKPSSCSTRKGQAAA